MSRSYHVTIKDFRGKTKREIDEMAEDPHSPLQEWSKKGSIKRSVKKARIIKKQNPPI